MPHFAKPFFKKSHKSWYVQLGGHQINLGKDEDDAYKKYYALMSDHADGKPVGNSDKSDGPTVPEILDKFLDSCQKDAAPRTFETYRDRLRPFVAYLQRKKLLDLPAADLKPIHILDWLDAHPSWNPGMRRGSIQSVQRAFNWADEVGLIESSPVAKMRKPPQGKRDTSVTEADYVTMMADVPEGPFKELLRFAWLTGCRPQESIRIEARHADLPNDRIVLPPRESKGKKKARIVYLVDDAKAILRPLIDDNPTGPLFRNADGALWTRFAVNCAFCRLQIASGKRKIRELGLAPTEAEIAELVPTLKPTLRVGKVVRTKRPAELREEAKRKLTFLLAKKHANKCCAYLFRHSFSTNALLNGVDPMTVSVLLGHTTGATLAKVYSHLSQHPAHLKDAAKKATGG